MQQETAAQDIQIAIQHHQAGRLAEAETLYRRILAQFPNQADALHLLGVLAAQTGRVDLAIDLIGHAIAANPSAGDYRINLGNALREAKRFGEAADAYRQAVRLRPDSADAHSNLGHALRELGNTGAAISAYRDAVRLGPDHADAMKHLGVSLTADGQLDEAIDTFRRAVQLQNDPDTQNHLAGALGMAGKVDEAIATYREALRSKPDSPELEYNLGIALEKQQLLDEAIAAYARAIRLRPAFVQAHTNLGCILDSQGKHREAIACHARAIEINPDSAGAHYNLGNALGALGESGGAIAAYEKAIELDPQSAPAHNNLGNVFKKQGRLGEAAAVYSRAIEVDPGYAEAYSNLGDLLREQWDLDAAAAACAKAIQLKPDLAAAHTNLAMTLTWLGKLDEAVVACERAIALKPDSPGDYVNLGNVLKDQGRLDDALAAYDRAMTLKPDDAGFHSSRVYTIHFHPGYDAANIYLEHRRWNERHAARLAGPKPAELPKQVVSAYRDSPDPQRRLKIGYVSPDFRSHPIGRFLEPLMRHHDRAAFEIFCYSDVRAPDSWTARFRALPDTWRPIVGVSNEDVARLIVRDGIDILIDLTMHMADHRLLVFARKPAPVQVTYLAYCSTTGLDAIDYRLTDPYIDPFDEAQGGPPGSTDENYSEKSIRLAETYWCYEPGFATPEPAPLPALSAGHITFGCLNNFAKVSQPALLTWCRLLREVPRSRLVLHAKEGKHRARVMDVLRCEGVDPQRLAFVGYLPVAEFFQLHQKIDIGLDTFPYAGGTTTCDALWMGVPVVSLAGRTGVGRAGVSILSNVGLAELIAQSEDQYVRLAEELSGDLPRLAALRGGLRERMRRSPLCDAVRFARNVESAYREMWKRSSSDVLLPLPCT